MKSMQADMHGLLLEAAVEKTERLLYECYHRHIPVLEIITGTGIINTTLLELARHHPMVSAVLNDGPIGNIYCGRIVLEISLAGDL